MHITLTATHPGSPDRVVAARTDPAFLEEVSRRAGALTQTVEATVGPDGSGRTLARRTVATTDFPDIARKFVGATIVIVEETEWDPVRGEVRTGRARMHAEGVPVELIGRIELHPQAASCVETIVGEISAKVPLVGGRLEKAVGPALREGFDAQTAVLRDWLARTNG